MSKPIGRPLCPEREAWAMRFGLKQTHPPRLLPDDLCRQLCQCRDDAARRLLLGVSS